jgi:hypothetical protein
MKTNKKTEDEPYLFPGDRLSHILEIINFKQGRGRQGRGRVTDFHSFLIKSQLEVFSDLKYTTVRSWFQESAPSMLKIDAIISALQDKYTFHNDISQIKTWWKVGGFYPFIDTSDEASRTILDLQQEAKESEEKLQFIVMSLVTEVTGDLFDSLSSEDRVRIKDKAIKMVTDFADPYMTECPAEYIKILIKNELDSLLEEKKL